MTPHAPRENGGLRRDLGLADLVWFNILIVLGVQGIAMSAHIGPVAIVLHLLAAAAFSFHLLTWWRRCPGASPATAAFTRGFVKGSVCFLRLCAGGRGGLVSYFFFP